MTTKKQMQLDNSAQLQILLEENQRLRQENQMLMRWVNQSLHGPISNSAEDEYFLTSREQLRRIISRACSQMIARILQRARECKKQDEPETQRET